MIGFYIIKTIFLQKSSIKVEVKIKIEVKVKDEIFIFALIEKKQKHGNTIKKRHIR
jgi:hypothetical protein